jgi:hypothetical protein
MGLFHNLAMGQFLVSVLLVPSFVFKPYNPFDSIYSIMNA